MRLDLVCCAEIVFAALVGGCGARSELGHGTMQPADAAVPDARAADAADAADASVPPGTLLWVKGFSGTNDLLMFDLASDPNANVLFTGDFTGSLDFGGGALGSPGLQANAFVASLDSSGNHLWSRELRDDPNDWSGNAVGQSIASDAAGHVLLGGTFFSQIDIGGPITTSASALLLASWNAQGAPLWVKAAPIFQGFAILRLAGSNFLLAGTYHGAPDFGTGPLTSNSAQYAILVAKLDGSRNLLWAHTYESSAGDDVTAIAADSAGRVFVTGGATGTFDLGAGPVSSTDPYFSDGFVLALDASGDYLWSKLLGSTQGQVSGLAIAPDGDLVVCGVFGGSMDLGLGAVATAGGTDAFVAKLHPTGEAVWVKSFGDDANQGAGRLAIDRSGHIAMVGAFDGTIDFGGGALAGVATSGDSNMASYLVDLDGAGTLRWQKRVVGSRFAWPLVAVDPDDAVLFAHGFNTETDVDGTKVSGTAHRDFFVAKFAP